MRPSWQLWTAISSVVLAAAVAFPIARAGYRRAHPKAAFNSLVGVAVPPGVTVAKYSSKMDDNLFHTTHYWLMNGDAGHHLAVY
jgi:ABC-type Fe3+ transport system permease subunit